MPNYTDVKQESVWLVDKFAADHDVIANYLKPPKKPRYSAETELATIGINKLVRHSMTKTVSAHMDSKFGKAWKGVGGGLLDPVETIGEFIELMCQQTGTVPTAGEPT